MQPDAPLSMLLVYGLIMGPTFSAILWVIGKLMQRRGKEPFWFR